MKLKKISSSQYISYYMYEKKGYKTYFIQVSNKQFGDILGEIKWYSRWRRYVFYPLNDTLFDSECLKDIISYIDNLMRERKEARKKDET